MIRFKVKDDRFWPAYQTMQSAGADVRAATDYIINPGKVGMIPIGVWLEPSKVLSRVSFEVQVRLRSSLAARHNLIMPNGVGTIDADYPDEIKVLIYNAGRTPYAILEGDRIAQLVVSPITQVPGIPVGGVRKGGFGSTGRK